MKDKVKEPTWENVAAYCRQNGMDLTAYGCTTYEDKLQTYDLYSLTISEVEIDCLTGEYKVKTCSCSMAQLNTHLNVNQNPPLGPF